MKNSAQNFRSCLYEGSVMHHRFAPKAHHLQHKIFMAYFDLDELDSLAQKIFLFSHNRKNLYAFRDDDHEPAGKNSLKQRVCGFARKNGIEIADEDRVALLTLPRVAGYIFNPISLYFCFGANEKPLCAIVEVGNTFGEKKLYLLRAKDFSGERFQKTVAKNFYVSPFSKLDLHFDFNLKIPGEKLEIRVDDFENRQKILISALTGARAEFTNRNLFWFTLKYPLITLKVIFLIHGHAFLLWLKRAPFHRKAENPLLQTEVLRPHSTLTAPTE
jgi:uncharacterized protein